MKGLIIKSKWADLILSGEKTWEIRGSQTHQRGRIGIIKSGTGKIFGSVELVTASWQPIGGNVEMIGRERLGSRIHRWSTIQYRETGEVRR